MPNSKLDSMSRRHLLCVAGRPEEQAAGVLQAPGDGVAGRERVPGHGVEEHERGVVGHVALHRRGRAAAAPGTTVPCGRLVGVVGRSCPRPVVMTRFDYRRADVNLLRRQRRNGCYRSACDSPAKSWAASRSVSRSTVRASAEARNCRGDGVA